MTTDTVTATSSDAQTLSPTGLRHRLAQADAMTIVDVRSPAEFVTAHIAGSRNVPLDLFTEGAEELAAGLPGDLVLVCQSGRRAAQACERLHAAGLSAAVLDGGIAAFEAAGGEVVRRGNRWAMDRQVRMAAGSLVLVGALAGQLIHPRLGLMAGAIGAGLAYSALTDSCAMASALSRMPWNRVEADPSLKSLFTPVPTVLLDR
ncbi:rhodanese-like domain-containing protein [Ornithinimicrobium cavernae]|uniref:rhodanese-like domain-containing protein n=1 Tax=Ornithinimicrobium cavernae TaxID=2666047 RepID=UPI000D697956